MREAFEKWVSKEYPEDVKKDALEKIDGVYFWSHTQFMWEAWQARDKEIEEKDKRIAELKEALEKHGRHLADCTFLPNWIDAECNCGLFEAIAKVKGK